MTPKYKSEQQDDYSDFKTVLSQRNDVIPEEFPEGPYGSNMMTETLGKSSPWRQGQKAISPFGYENQQLHDSLPRVYPAEDLEAADEP